MTCNALGLEFDSAVRLSKRPGSVWNCLWGHALKIYKNKYKYLFFNVFKYKYKYIWKVFKYKYKYFIQIKHDKTVYVDMGVETFVCVYVCVFVCV